MRSRKEDDRKAFAKWYAANREKKNAQSLAYYYANKDRYRAAARRYQAKHAQIIWYAQKLGVGMKEARRLWAETEAKRSNHVTTEGNHHDGKAHHQAPSRRGLRKRHADGSGLPLDRRADPGAGHSRTHGAPVR